MDKERPAAEYYRKAVEAIAEQDKDVPRMHGFEPDNVMLRRLLHGSEMKRDDNHGRTS